MKITKLLYILLISLSGTVSASTDKTLSPAYAACQAKAVSTFEVTECMYNEYVPQDNRLNAIYKKLNTQVSTERKTQLIEAQRAWVKYRDTNCMFYANPEGGTAATISSNLCILDMTVQRANELDKFVF